MRYRWSEITLVLAFSTFVCLTSASAEAPTPSHSGQREVTVSVRADMTAEKSSTLRVTLHTEAALTSFAVQRFTLRNGIDTLDVLEAYTEKPDGRRIPVEAAAIETRDVSPEEPKLAMRETAITFPALAVGDGLLLRTREISGRDASNPGYFDIFIGDEMLSQSIRIEAQKGVKLHITAGQGFEYAAVEQDAMTVHTLVQRPGPLPARKAEPGAVMTLAEKFSGAIVTTPPTYEEIGAGIWSFAGGKIEITPQIADLANDITRVIGGRRAQAQAIELWVKRNIRYRAIPMDVRGGMPNDAAGVLASRAGDCKEQSVLLSALLAAKGIASELVMINASGIYTFEAAEVLTFDHVIVYMPEFGIYSDPTVSLAAFGVLSPATYDKPVLRISAAGTTLARTPAMRAANHTTVSRTVMAVAADGTVSGHTTETATGVFATSARSLAARVTAQGADKVAADQLRVNGTPGTGRYDDKPLDSRAEPFITRGEFHLGTTLKTTGGAQAIPVGLATRGARPGALLFGVRHENRQLPFVCLAGRQVEEVELTFAEGLPLPTVGKGRRVANRYFTFTADVAVEGRTLRIRREFVSRVAGQVCAPEVEAEIAPAMKAVAANLQMKMTFPKHVAPAEPVN